MQLEFLENRTLLAGVTILTHGQSGTISGWIESAADAIQDRLGGTSAASQYVMKVGKSGVSSFDVEPGNKLVRDTTKGEVIIKLDWSDISDGSEFTDDIGKDVADFLITQTDLNGLPFQLIGHSRGASLMVAISYYLGRRGIWVDQVTNLDPHPIEIDIPIIGDIGDVKMETFDNVIFSDTYYREGDSLPIDPDGEPVDGSYNVDLKNSVGDDHDISAHLAVTAYYHGTIDFEADENNDSRIRDSWYNESRPDKPAREDTGYAFSRVGGKDRPLEGVGEAWGGDAERSEGDEDGTQFSNIINVRAVGTSIVGINQPITLKALYNDRDGDTRVTFYLDKDQNPLNKNNAFVFGTQIVGKSVDPAGVTMKTKVNGIDSGEYFLAAKIFDNQGHGRYAYSATPLTVEQADFTTFRDGVATVAATSKSDNIVISRSGSGASAVLSVTRNGLTQILDTPDVELVSVDGGAGNDTIFAEASSPALYAFGGDGNDSLSGGGANDTLSGGGGKNTLGGNDGNDRLNGSGSHDLLFGGSNDDRLYGNAGNDTLDGGGGVDRLFGGDGDDSLLGASSNDKLYGEAGNDTLNGQSQRDLLEGGSGNDSIIGGDQIDTLRGNSGDDFIDSRDNLAELIDAGSGNDRGRADENDTLISVETLV